MVCKIEQSKTCATPLYVLPNQPRPYINTWQHNTSCGYPVRASTFDHRAGFSYSSSVA